MYDIIGDIHGHAEALKKMLTKMGYAPINGIWQHPNRKLIFVGDFIDRGPAIREVLQIVRGMMENEHALAVMGNHEYNAIAYAYKVDYNEYLRPHNAMHNHQHQATLDQFAAYDGEWQEWVNWFYTLPLFLDLGEIRIVHACWDQQHIDWLQKNYNGKLTEELLISSHEIDSQANIVIEETLKGKEFNIPEHFAWADKDGHMRNTNRIKWWMHPSTSTHGEFLFSCPEILQYENLPEDIKFNIYPSDAPLVFFGHYWLEDKWPVIQTDNIVCLDYSIAKGGNLVAYRWDGESIVDKNKFEVITQ